MKPIPQEIVEVSWTLFPLAPISAIVLFFEIIKALIGLLF